MNNVLEDIGYSGLIADVREDRYPEPALDELKELNEKELDDIVLSAEQAFKNLDVIFKCVQL